MRDVDRFNTSAKPSTFLAYHKFFNRMRLLHTLLLYPGLNLPVFPYNLCVTVQDGTICYICHWGILILEFQEGLTYYLAQTYMQICCCTAGGMAVLEDLSLLNAHFVPGGIFKNFQQSWKSISNRVMQNQYPQAIYRSLPKIASICQCMLFERDTAQKQKSE